MTVHTFALTGPVNLSVRLGHGSLTVQHRDDLTEARVELEGPPDALERMLVERSGATLRVQAPRQGGLADLISAWRPGMAGTTGKVDAVVTVPSGTALEITTFTASVDVRGRSGGVSVATAAGTITLDHVDGDLLLRYGSSDSTARTVTGSATVRSGTGSARFGEVGGNLEAGCGRGTLSADRVRGTVRSRSGAGEATIGAAFGDVDLASGSGSMNVGLPAGVTAQVDVTTGSGTLRTDLPVEQEPATREGAITVRARTGSGDVRLFRAAA